MKLHQSMQNHLWLGLNLAPYILYLTGIAIYVQCIEEFISYHKQFFVQTYDAHDHLQTNANLSQCYMVDMSLK